MFRVCPKQRAASDPPVYYTGTITTTPSSAPATQPAQPPKQIGTSVGVTVTQKHSAVGWGAIKTRTGLAWFWLRASNTGLTRVHFDDKAQRLHMRDDKNNTAAFDGKRLTIHAGGLTLVLVDGGARDSITVTSKTYKAAGTVVRGGMRVS